LLGQKELPVGQENCLSGMVRAMSLSLPTCSVPISHRVVGLFVHGRIGVNGARRRLRVGATLWRVWNEDLAISLSLSLSLGCIATHVQGESHSTVVKSVAKSTTHCVVGRDYGLKKFQQIVDRGLPQLSEDDLFELIRTLPAKKLTDKQAKFNQERNKIADVKPTSSVLSSTPAPATPTKKTPPSKSKSPTATKQQSPSKPKSPSSSKSPTTSKSPSSSKSPTTKPAPPGEKRKLEPFPAPAPLQERTYDPHSFEQMPPECSHIAPILTRDHSYCALLRRYSMLWADKYRPARAADLIGNPSIVEKLTSWLRTWYVLFWPETHALIMCTHLVDSRLNE